MSTANNISYASEAYLIPPSFYIAWIVFNAVSLMTAIVGNFLVLGTIWKTPFLHLPANVLLFGLALSDFVVGLVVQPMFVAWLIQEMVGLKGEFDGEFWILYRSIQATLVSASVLTLAAVNVDKYLCLLLHLRYSSIVTIMRVGFVLIIIWSLSIIHASTLSFAPSVFDILSIIITSFSVLTCMVIYFLIYRIVRRHQEQIQTQAQVQGGGLNMKRYMKSVMSMLVVFLVLIFCYFPYFAVRLALKLGINWNLMKIVTYIRSTACVVYLNSSLNPFVYFWRMPELRAAMKVFLKRLLNKD